MSGSPSFLIARITPALSRSCRLAIDLPVLGVLTWLCAGARRPRRGIATRDLWRRLAEILPNTWTDRERGNALRRLWRAGLVTVDAHQHWRPCWFEDAMMARLDVALWRRRDVSAAAKRTHAMIGHRVASGWSDAVRWLGERTGSSRGRIGAAIAELVQLGVMHRDGWVRAGGRRWHRMATGTQSEGVPLRQWSTDPLTPAACRPMTQLRPLSGPRRDGPRRTWLAAIDSARARGLAALFDLVHAGTPRRRLTPTGAAGLQAARERAIERLRVTRTGPAIVAGWLAGMALRGVVGDRAGRALWAALHGHRPLDGFALRSGGLDALPSRGRLAPEAAAVCALGGLPRDVRDRVLAPGWRFARAALADREALAASGARAGPLTMGPRGAISGSVVLRLHAELQKLDRAYAEASPFQRARTRTRYLSCRQFLLSRLTPTTPCRRSESISWRTAGSP